MEQRRDATHSSANAAEGVRTRRLREDAQRSLSVNLAEGIALSHKLMRFTGAARRSCGAPRTSTSWTTRKTSGRYQ